MAPPPEAAARARTEQPIIKRFLSVAATSGRADETGISRRSSHRQLISPVEAAAMRMERVKWVLVGIGGLLPALLLAAHPLLTLFEENETELPLAVIWQPLGITFAVAAVLYGVLVLVTRTWAKAGALTALAVFWFFSFDTFKSAISGLHLSGGWALALWTALCDAPAVGLARANRGQGPVLLGIGVYAAVLTLLPALKIASYQQKPPGVHGADPRLWTADPLSA